MASHGSRQPTQEMGAKHEPARLPRPRRRQPGRRLTGCECSSTAARRTTPPLARSPPGSSAEMGAKPPSRSGRRRNGGFRILHQGSGHSLRLRPWSRRGARLNNAEANSAPQAVSHGTQEERPVTSVFPTLDLLAGFPDRRCLPQARHIGPDQLVRFSVVFFTHGAARFGTFH